MFTGSAGLKYEQILPSHAYIGNDIIFFAIQGQLLIFFLRFFCQILSRSIHNNTECCFCVARQKLAVDWI